MIFSTDDIDANYSMERNGRDVICNVVSGWRRRVPRHHHVVSATPIGHLTDRSFISAMSSLVGLSRAARRAMVDIACGCAARTVFALSVAPHIMFAAGVSCPERTRLAVRHARHGSM